MLADEPHEPATTDVRLDQFAVVLLGDSKLLHGVSADGCDDHAGLGELRQDGLRKVRDRGGNHDPVERPLFGQPQLPSPMRNSTLSILSFLRTSRAAADRSGDLSIVKTRLTKRARTAV